MNNFLRKIRSKLFQRPLYPELEKTGGLSNAINLEFEKLKSALKVAIDKNCDELPMTYARVEYDNKFSQIYIAAKEKLYLPDFWRDGVCLANGSTNNISKLALAVDYWLTNNVSTHVLAEKFDFINPSETASSFDENREVEYAWQSLLKDGDNLGLKDFTTLAAEDEVLNKLFPFTSLYTLCFSRCTGYPFETTGLPNVTPIEYIHFALPKNEPEYAKVQQNGPFEKGEIYVITINRSQFVGTGNASESLKIVRDNLPEDIRRARKGTAED